MAKPGPISAKPLSVLLSDVFSDAYAKQGFAARDDQGLLLVGAFTPKTYEIEVRKRSLG